MSFHLTSSFDQWQYLEKNTFPSKQSGNWAYVWRRRKNISQMWRLGPFRPYPPSLDQLSKTHRNDSIAGRSLCLPCICLHCSCLCWHVLCYCCLCYRFLATEEKKTATVSVNTGFSIVFELDYLRHWYLDFCVDQLRRGTLTFQCSAFFTINNRSAISTQERINCINTAFEILAARLDRTLHL